MGHLLDGPSLDTRGTIETIISYSSSALLNLLLGIPSTLLLFSGSSG